MQGGATLCAALESMTLLILTHSGWDSSLYERVWSGMGSDLHLLSSIVRGKTSWPSGRSPDNVSASIDESDAFGASDSTSFSCPSGDWSPDAPWEEASVAGLPEWQVGLSRTPSCVPTSVPWGWSSTTRLNAAVSDPSGLSFTSTMSATRGAKGAG